MKATAIQIDSEDDLFFSLNIWFSYNHSPTSIMICRDGEDDPETIIFTETLDQLYSIQTSPEYLTYQISNNILLFILKPYAPYCFFSNGAKQQQIEINSDDVARVQNILDRIFESVNPIIFN